MHLPHLPGSVHLTYCTNIHAADSWPDISSSLDEHVPAIRAAVAAGQPFGIGLRLSGRASLELSEPAALAAFQAQLTRLGAYVFTINAFPYGPFHGEQVKERVYQPDWCQHERVAFTLRCAEILALLLPTGMTGSISSVPGAFKAELTAPGTMQEIAEHIVDAVAGLIEIKRRTGRHIVLALEPEPCCMLETVDETLAFFAEYLFAAAARERVARSTGLSADAAEAALRGHVGVCYDVCHGAVEFEDPALALGRLKAAGIGIAKIQLSSAMRVPVMQASLVPALRCFDDGVYLHQVVVVKGKSVLRYVDLPQALAAFEQGLADGEWRVHCHVPVFLGDLGEIGTTQRQLQITLDALKAQAFSNHLEVETYTWDVLPEALKTSNKAQAIARELSFVVGALGA